MGWVGPYGVEKIKFQEAGARFFFVGVFGESMVGPRRRVNENISVQSCITSRGSHERENMKKFWYYCVTLEAGVASLK